MDRVQYPIGINGEATPTIDIFMQIVDRYFQCIGAELY
jgi:hypothetical protein